MSQQINTHEVKDDALFNLDQFNTKGRSTGPTLTFDERSMCIRLNDNEIKYENQILTSKGLEINDGRNQVTMQQKIIMVPQKQSKQFDKKYCENQYCIELANTIDRSTNSLFYLRERREKTRSKSQKQIQVGPQIYNLEVCEFVLKKIPYKQKCFELVFKNIPIQKIPILFENDKFYNEIVLFIFNLLFRTNVSQLYKMQKSTDCKSLNFSSQSQSNMTSQNLNYKSPKKVKPPLTSFQKKVVKTYQALLKQTGKLKKCIERINLLLTLFTRELRLNCFLYDLNRQIISQEMSKNFEKLFEEENAECRNYKQKKQKIQKNVRQCQILDKIMLIIKTIHASVGKTQISAKLIANYCLKNECLTMWLKLNLQKFEKKIESGQKLLEFLSLIGQFNTNFINRFYEVFILNFDRIILNQVRWIYETLHTIYPSQQQQIKMKNLAESTLDNLLLICKASIKQNTSPGNLGRYICKNLCEYAVNLRPCDIEVLTYICCTNSSSRSTVLKYLFSFFRKFIKNLKSSLKGPKMKVINIMKKHRHQMLQIIQSIRKISEIQSIDLTIDSDIMNDIEKILQVHNISVNNLKDNKDNKDKKNWKGDCLTSAYQAMLRNVKIQKPLQTCPQANLKAART